MYMVLQEFPIGIHVIKLSHGNTSDENLDCNSSWHRLVEMYAQKTLHLSERTVHTLCVYFTSLAHKFGSQFRFREDVITVSFT